MRFLAIIVLVVLLSVSAEALRKRQLQVAHAGFCPMHQMACAIYCPPTSFELLTPRANNGCKRDSECASNEKCCRPACGCTNRCAVASEKPGFGNLLGK